jgi:RimJ/RimL family protein N-acetyltransferase
MPQDGIVRVLLSIRGHMNIIETKKLYLRELTLSDQSDLARVLSDAESMAHYPHPFSASEVAGWIRWNLANYKTHGHGLWAVIRREDGAFLGDCGLTMQEIEGQRLPELGYHIIKEYWGNGYAGEAAAACIAYAFDDLGMDAIYSYTTPDNLASRRVAEKNGMVLVKTFKKELYGKAYEEVLYCLKREDWKGV